MAVLTTLAQLEQVQTAITDILVNGQSYSMTQRATARADLAALQDRESMLLARYQVEQNGRPTNFVRFDRPQS